MLVRVIVPPEPIVTPDEIAGSHAGDDATVAALIAAVTATIDGPGGWVGRAFGVQTLEAALDRWPSCVLRLPYPPIIGNISIIYLDSDRVEHLVDEGDYFLIDDMLCFRTGWPAPAIGPFPVPIRIRYEAGYDDAAVAEGGTGPLDPRVKQAIIVSVQHLKATMAQEDLFLRSVEIPDVETRQFVVSDQAANLVRMTAERLLDGLRVYS